MFFLKVSMFFKNGLIRFSLLFFILISLWGCNEKQLIEKAPTILVVGDSLSAGYQIGLNKGWVNLMSNKLQKENLQHNIINISVNGATTSDALKAIKNGNYHNVDILVLAIGANDALKRVEPEISLKNIQSIINDIEAKSSPQILLINLQPPRQLGVFGLGMFQYRQIYTQIRDKNTDYYYIDNLMKNLDNTNFLSDMIHPNISGQEIMLQNVYPTIEKIIKSNYK